MTKTEVYESLIAWKIKEVYDLCREHKIPFHLCVLLDEGGDMIDSRVSCYIQPGDHEVIRALYHLVECPELAKPVIDAALVQHLPQAQVSTIPS